LQRRLQVDAVRVGVLLTDGENAFLNGTDLRLRVTEGNLLRPAITVEDLRLRVTEGDLLHPAITVEDLRLQVTEGDLRRLADKRIHKGY
jgi:hypothetical protein